jgi:hypothetical protein
MAAVIRKCRYPDIILPNSLSTIIENALKNKTALVAKRATRWSHFYQILKQDPCT